MSYLGSFCIVELSSFQAKISSSPAIERPGLLHQKAFFRGNLKFKKNHFRMCVLKKFREKMKFDTEFANSM